MIQLIDSHCHVHEPGFNLRDEDVIKRAFKDGVTKMVCVGTDAKTSKEATDFVKNKDFMRATVGLHPHDAKLGQPELDKINKLINKPGVVGVGEIGLDYYYDNSKRSDQISVLEQQIQLALDNNLVIVFHMRDAYEDFWPVFDNYKGIKGVIHSFTATTKELDQALARDLYIGLNGIMTFTKDEKQLAAARLVPMNKLMLETDAPFLTPTPIRGTMNEPKNVRLIAEFLAELKGVELADLARATTSNAEQFFGL